MNSLILVILNIIWVSATDIENRIIGGFDAERYQFPYMVSLQLFGKHYCGGSILTDTWVVSAAHCFINITEGWMVVAGLINLGEIHPDVQIVPATQIINHEYFYIDKSTGYYDTDNDIAMVKLLLPLQFTAAVRPVALPQPNQEFVGNVWLSGWGVYKLLNTMPRRLQYLEMYLINNNECSRFSQGNPIKPTMVCSAPLLTNIRSTGCRADSGGPLVQNGILVGIVSFGHELCGPGVMFIVNIFTRVSHYIDFIKFYL